MSTKPLQPDPREMTNEELYRAWEAVNDHDNLSPDDQAIIDEMDRRHIEY
ncbi:hypothetical protein [Sphingobium sp. ZW T5_29]